MMCEWILHACLSAIREWFSLENWMCVFPRKFHNDSVSVPVLLVHKNAANVGSGGIRWKLRHQGLSQAISPLKRNLKLNVEWMVAILPVLDQGYYLRVGLPNDALSIHLHYPVPWKELENKLQTCCLLLTAAWQINSGFQIIFRSRVQSIRLLTEETTLGKLLPAQTHICV